MNKENKFSLENLMGKFGFSEMGKEQFSELFTLKDIGISARVLHHWSKYGLLFDDDREYDMNHRFSFIDLIWLKIILELRRFGFPLNKIKLVKQSVIKKKTLPEMLNWKTDKDIVENICRIHLEVSDVKLLEKTISNPELLSNIKTKKFTVLHLLLSNYLNHRDNTKLIISNGGIAIPFFGEDMSFKLIGLLDKEPFLSIPIYKLILNFIEEEKNFDTIPQIGIFNDKEIFILMLIRTGNFRKITITLKGTNPVALEAMQFKKIYKETRLNELFLTRGYEEITVVSKDGEITYSTRSLKMNF